MQQAVLIGPLGQEIFKQQIFVCDGADLRQWQDPAFLGATEKKSIRDVLLKDVLPFFAIPGIVVLAMMINERQVRRWYRQHGSSRAPTRRR